MTSADSRRGDRPTTPWWRTAVDVAGPRLRDAAGTLRAWGRGAFGSFVGGLAEFAAEEAGLLAGRAPATIQADAIEALERDVAALSARVDALASRR